MPHIKFTDSTLKTLTVDKTTWFTDPSCKGLRLCVTGGGTKTWYANKWDPTSQKTRSVKLAQWANKGAHCRWAKEQIGKITHDIATGNVFTREEKEVAQAALGIPTFRDALEQYIEHRTTARQSGRARMMDSTAYDYRMSFNKHLARWADVHVNELPILEINQYLNNLQIDTPNAAHLAASVAGAMRDRVIRVLEGDSLGLDHYDARHELGDVETARKLWEHEKGAAERAHQARLEAKRRRNPNSPRALNTITKYSEVRPIILGLLDRPRSFKDLITATNGDVSDTTIRKVLQIGIEKGELVQPHSNTYLLASVPETAVAEAA